MLNPFRFQHRRNRFLLGIFRDTSKGICPSRCDWRTKIFESRCEIHAKLVEQYFRLRFQIAVHADPDLSRVAGH